MDGLVWSVYVQRHRIILFSDFSNRTIVATVKSRCIRTTKFDGTVTLATEYIDVHQPKARSATFLMNEAKMEETEKEKICGEGIV